MIISVDFLNHLHSIYNKNNDLSENAKRIFKEYKCSNIYEHSVRVAHMAKKLAVRFRANEESAYIAALLHDIGGIVPNGKRIEIANILKIPLFPEEIEFPLIIHQKISKVIAEKVFLISDHSILNAIECHTTLKSNPSMLDKIVFISDKIEWDQKGSPPYINSLIEALDVSIDCASNVYIKFLMENKNNLKVIHPWLSDSYNYFKK
ncbi:bis(5'-nucleosyl)-tetraphosphatase (symmetrical) YqeK [Bacillus subtilis]